MLTDVDNAFTETKIRGQDLPRILIHNQNKPKTVRLSPPHLILNRISFFNSQLFQIILFLQQKPVIHYYVAQELYNQT